MTLNCRIISSCFIPITDSRFHWQEVDSKSSPCLEETHTLTLIKCDYAKKKKKDTSVIVENFTIRSKSYTTRPTHTHKKFYFFKPTMFNVKSDISLGQMALA